MKRISKNFLIALCSLSGTAFAAGDVPTSFTLDGTLYDSPAGTSTLHDSAVRLRVQILPPTGTCVLYDEEQTVSTVASDGAFSIQVGTAVGSARRVSGSDSGNPMTAVFQNQDSIPGNANGCSYVPVAGATRRVRVIVTPTSGAADTLTPDLVLSSVPSALTADTLQGVPRTGFLQLGAGSLSQANVENVFSSSNYPTLSSLLSGGGASSSGGYAINAGTGGSGGIDFNVNGSTKAAIANNGNFSVDSGSFFVDAASNRVGIGTSTPGASLDLGAKTDAVILPSGTTGQRPSPASAGMIRFNASSSKLEFHNGTGWSDLGSDISGIAAGGDLSGTYPNPGVSKLRGQSVSANASADGQVLRFDGTNYTPAFVAMGDLRSRTTGAAALSASCTPKQTLTWSSVSDTLACTNIDGLDGAAITTGTISAARLPSSVKSWDSVSGGINYAGGFVGIGVPSPARPLQVAGNIAESDILTVQNTAADGYASVNFVDSDGNDKSSSGYGNASANLSYTRGNAFTWLSSGVNYVFGNDSTPLLTIQNGGNVGIGTPPTNRLTVAQTTDSAALVVRNLAVANDSVFNVYGPLSSSMTNGKGFSIFAGTETFARARFFTDGKFALGSGANFQDVVLSRQAAGTMKVSSDGASGAGNLLITGTLGIGTTAPSAKLDVHQTANAISTIALSTPGTASAQQLGFNFVTKADGNGIGGAGNKGWQFGARGDAWSNASQQNDLFFSYWNGSAWTPAHTFDSVTGNLGIGTTAPGYPLDVNGTVNATAYHLNGVPFTPGSTSSAAPATGGSSSSTTQTGTNAATADRTALLLRNNGTGGAFEYNLIGQNAAGTTTSSIKQDGSAYFAGNMSVGLTSTAYGNLSVGASLGIASFNTSPSMYFYRLGPAPAANSQVAGISIRPSDGSAQIATAGIGAYVTAGATVAAGSVPTDLTFSTGSTAAVERLRITSGGSVTMSPTNSDASGTTNYVDLKASLAPTAATSAQVNGISSQLTTSTVNNFTGNLTGFRSYVNHTGSGTADGLYGIYSGVNQNHSSGTSTSMYGIYNDVTDTNGTVGSAYGSYNYVRNANAGTVGGLTGTYNWLRNVNSGTVTNAYGTNSYVQNNGTGTITNAYGFYASAPMNASTGAITNYYGLYIQNPTAAGTNYSIYSAGGNNYFGGSVGVGTNTPTAPLHVASASAARINLQKIGDHTSEIYDDGDLHITSNNRKLWVNAYSSGAMVLNLGGGNVGIGNVTSPTYKLDVDGDLRITGIPYRAGGDVAWTVPSDERLKDVKGSYEHGLDAIAKLRTVRFHYKEGNAVQASSGPEYIGVLAQEVQKVIPEAVSMNEKSGFLNLNTTPIFWGLVNATKELKDRCEAGEEASGIQSRALASLQREHDQLKQKAQHLEAENSSIKAYLCAKDPSAPFCRK